MDEMETAIWNFPWLERTLLSPILFLITLLFYCKREMPLVFTVYFSTGSTTINCRRLKRARLKPKSSYRINIDRDHLLLPRNERALLEP